MALRAKTFGAYRRRDAPFAASTAEEGDRPSCRTHSVAPAKCSEHMTRVWSVGSSIHADWNVDYPTQDLKPFVKKKEIALAFQVRWNFPAQFALTVCFMHTGDVVGMKQSNNERIPYGGSDERRASRMDRLGRRPQWSALCGIST